MIEVAVDKTIRILEWAIKNKSSLADACRHFNQGIEYARNTRKRNKNHEILNSKYEEYRRAIANNAYSTDVPKEQIDELLSKDTIVEKEEVTFKQEMQNAGVLDARGNKHVRTLAALVQEAKIDLTVWNVDRHICNVWDVTNSMGQTYQNWQVKAWLSKNIEKEAAIEINDFYKDLLNKHNPFKYKPVAYKKQKEENLLEISIFDAHVGKLCWSEENRGEDYDIKIASKRFNEAIVGAIKRTSGNDFNKILFIVGNDFFNSDTILNTTTNGTPQDEDTRWKKTFRMGFKLLVEAIDYLRQYAPVDIVVVPGNHDETRAFFLGHSLESWYREDKCVNIDNSAPLRKYYRYGKVLIGLTHGDKEKEDRLPQLMAHEAKKDWAETEHHEWHLAHLHKKMANKYKVPIYNEDLGVIIRRLSSISGADKWHFDKSYVGCQRAAEAFLWNINEGLFGHYNINITM